jgi:hypothetical protein
MEPSAYISYSVWSSLVSLLIMVNPDAEFKVLVMPAS